MIALSIKRNITPHIRSAKIAKQAWDTLAHLYAGRNEAKISYLRKELESKVMQEEDDMNVFLDKIKYLKEQLIFSGEIIPDHSLLCRLFLMHYQSRIRPLLLLGDLLLRTDLMLSSMIL